MKNRRNVTDQVKSYVSLTFDDGPDPIWTPRVLEALRKAQARATFFVVAPRATEFPGLISEILQDGHGVELHCTHHVRHTELTRDEIESDTRAGMANLETLGVRPWLWRPPWGVLSPWTEPLAERFGLQLALWTIDTHDWRGDPASEMLTNAEAPLESGSVILLHDGLGPGALRSGCEETVAVIGELVNSIRQLGCEPAPMILPNIGTAPAMNRVRV